MVSRIYLLTYALINFIFSSFSFSLFLFLLNLTGGNWNSRTQPRPQYWAVSNDPSAHHVHDWHPGLCQLHQFFWTGKWEEHAIWWNFTAMPSAWWAAKHIVLNLCKKKNERYVINKYFHLSVYPVPAYPLPLNLLCAFSFLPLLPFAKFIFVYIRTFDSGYHYIHVFCICWIY